MEIKIKGYTLKDSLGVKSFDLYKDHENTNRKTGKKKIVDVNIAWGVTIERAIDIIVQDKMKEDIETVYLKDFLSEYKNYNKELLTEIKNLKL